MQCAFVPISQVCYQAFFTLPNIGLFIEPFEIVMYVVSKSEKISSKCIIFTACIAGNFYRSASNTSKYDHDTPNFF